MFQLMGYGVVLILCTFSHQSAAKFMQKKADWILTCRYKDPEYTKCSTKSVQVLFDNVATALEEIDMPSLDPYKINQLRILSGDGPVSLNSSLSKVLVHGFSKTKVVKNQSHKDFSWTTHIFMPKMRLEGQYNMRGRILVLPLNGHGNILLEPSNMNIVFQTKTKLVEREGFIFYDVKSTKVDYNMTGLKLRLDNLFEGIPELEESTNQYLNENWRLLADALKPIIEQTIEKILIDVMSKIFDYIPATYFIEDIPTPSELYGTKS